MAPEARLDPETWYGSPSSCRQMSRSHDAPGCSIHVGASMADVVRADVYLTDMDDRFELEEVWRKHFPTDPPARTYIPTVRLGAKSCIVEVNVIAIRPGSGRKKETITARNVPTPDLHHPHAVRAGDLLFVSGLSRHRFQGRTGVAGANQRRGTLVHIEREAADWLYCRLPGVRFAAQAAATCRTSLGRRICILEPEDVCSRQWRCGTSVSRANLRPRWSSAWDDRFWPRAVRSMSTPSPSAMLKGATVRRPRRS